MRKEKKEKGRGERKRPRMTPSPSDEYSLTPAGREQGKGKREGGRERTRPHMVLCYVIGDVVISSGWGRERERGGEEGDGRTPYYFTENNVRNTLEHWPNRKGEREKGKKEGKKCTRSNVLRPRPVDAHHRRFVRRKRKGERPIARSPISTLQGTSSPGPSEKGEEGGKKEPFVDASGSTLPILAALVKKEGRKKQRGRPLVLKGI